MTEEEKVAWAKSHTWEPRKRYRGNNLALANKKLAKKIISARLQDQKNYHSGDKKYWGDDYNARIRYLYQHNEEFRELKKYRVYLRRFRMKRDQYDGWTHKYYQEYKQKMESKAQVFKIEGTQNFMYGFTIKELCKYSPFNPSLTKSLLTRGLFPAPKYRGHLFHKDKSSEEVHEFYLVSEVEAYLNIFARYRKRAINIANKEQELYLKKQLWEEMLKARKEFDND